MRARASLWTTAIFFLGACGGGHQEVRPVEKQSAAEEILRIGDVWTSIQPEKGILSPPSKISLFRVHRKSELRMSEGRVEETLTIEEEAQLRDGPVITCRTVFQNTLGHRWGRRHDEAALELVRPALHGDRNCNLPHPDGPISEPARRALFVLRSDTLVAVEPAVDQRTYVSGPL